MEDLWGGAGGQAEKQSHCRGSGDRHTNEDKRPDVGTVKEVDSA